MKSVFPYERWLPRGGRYRGICTVAALALAACGQQDGQPPAAPAGGTVEVGVVTLAPQDLPVVTELSGRAKTRVSAEIRPQVGGILHKRLFEEGDTVRQGQVLYEIDPATYRAAFNSAQASVLKAEATLAAARVTARRNAELAKISAISQQSADDSAATLRQSEAELAVARAALETARIDLAYTKVTAPIGGRIDISQVSQGALVTASQSDALTTVRQLDPLVIDVTQSSADLLRLQKELASGSLDAASGIPVQVLLEDGSAYAHAGELQFKGASVDEGTGSVTLRVLVPNPDGLLLPGMYLRVQLQQAVALQAILAPQKGISRGAGGQATALVVTAGNVVEQRNVTLGRAVGNQWQVSSGLQAGDRLIVEGLQNAVPGSDVQVVDAGASAAAGKN